MRIFPTEAGKRRFNGGIEVLKTVKHLLLGVLLIVLAGSVLLVSDYRGRVGNARLSGGDPAAALHRKVRSGEPVRAAILTWNSSVTLEETRRGLLTALAERGFANGEGLDLQVFSPEGDMPAAVSMAQNACGGEYDLVLTISTPMLQVAAAANKAGKAVHVFGAVTDPYAAGVGINRENHRDHPAWLAGVGTFQPVREAVLLCRRLYPGLKRVGTVMNPSEACSRACFDLAKKTCEEIGIEFLSVTADNSSAVYEAASALTSQGIQAFIVGGDNTVESAFESLVRAADAAGIPVIGYAAANARKGALAGLGADYVDVGRFQGYLAAEILKGASPADIPVENVMPLKCSLNKTVLKKLKEPWSIPPEVEAQAAEIIDESGVHAVSRDRAAALPTPVVARPRTLRFLDYVESAPAEATLRGFRKALRDAGWTEGKEYVLSVSNAQGDMPTLSAMIDDVPGRNADVLVLTSTPALQAALRKVRTIPVIFGVVANPVAAGAGTSDADHLPNVTGVSSASAYAEGVAATLGCVPGTKRVGTLVNPSEANCVYNLERVTEELAARGVECVSVPVSTPAEISDGIRALLSRNVDAVLQVVGNIFMSSFAPISKACLNARVPLFAFDTSVATDGGAAVTVARDYEDGGQEMGRLAVRVLGGESPASIPFETIGRTVVTINEANVRRYGLTVPEDLRRRARSVPGE